MYCNTLLLEIHLQTSSSSKWKHISIIKEEKEENDLPDIIKINKTGVYTPPILFMLPVWEYMYLVVKDKVLYFVEISTYYDYDSSFQKCYW